jgi:hypothetical protein
MNESLREREKRDERESEDDWEIETTEYTVEMIRSSAFRFVRLVENDDRNI